MQKQTAKLCRSGQLNAKGEAVGTHFPYLHRTFIQLQRLLIIQHHLDTDTAVVFCPGHQTFLKQMETAMAKHPLFSNSSATDQDAATEVSKPILCY